MPRESPPQAVHSTVHCGLIEATKAEDKESLPHHRVSPLPQLVFISASRSPLIWQP